METVRESVFKLLDYRGDITKNKESGVSSYSKDFSPNNIRRVIISTDGVLVQLHKPVKNYGYSIGGVCYNIFNFKPDTLRKEQIEPKYKPLLSLFASSNIFSAVEEIILLSNPVSVASGDINRENDVSYMVAGYNGQGNLQEKVKGRFKRLRYYTVLNCNWANFMNWLQQTRAQALKDDYLSENPNLASMISMKTELNTEEDAKTSITVNSTYLFDNTLRAYFEGIKEGYLEVKKGEKVDAFKKEKKSKEIEEVNESIKKYIGFVRVCQRYKKVLNTVGTNGVVYPELLSPNISFSPIYDFDGICSVPKNLLSKGKEYKQAVELNKENSKQVRVVMRDEFSNIFFKALNSLCNNQNQFTISALMNFEERTIYVPTESQAIVSSLYKTFASKFDGKPFTAEKPTASIINCLWLICFMFLDRDSDNYKAEYITREYWEGVLKND